MTAPHTVPLADLLARVPDGVGIDVPGPEGGWAVAVIGGRVYRARVAPAAVDVRRLRRAASLMRDRANEPVAQPARWPQKVALPIAYWLDHVADAREAIDGIARHRDEPPGQGSECFLTQERHALAVANAYLQETP